MRYGFIGLGNMGGAIVKGILSGDSFSDDEVYGYDIDSVKAEQLYEEAGVSLCDSVADLAGHSDVIILAVKPQMMRGVLEEIAPVLKAREDRFVLVTIAAGLTMESIQEMAGGNYPVIRLMPNMPAAVGQGMILYCSAKTHLDEMVTFLHIMKEAGRFSPLPEKLIDAGASVAGCGPAFVDLFVEALADGGVACGLPRAQAMEFAAQMVAGSAKLILESKKQEKKISCLV